MPLAYIVSNREVSVTELRLLSPDSMYMIPDEFIMLDAFPVLPNGKTDRMAPEL